MSCMRFLIQIDEFYDTGGIGADLATKNGITVIKHDIPNRCLTVESTLTERMTLTLIRSVPGVFEVKPIQDEEEPEPTPAGRGEGPPDFLNMDQEELESHGFRWWDEKNGIMLVPHSLYGALPNGTVLYDINGGTVVKGQDNIDMDTRFGLLAYGIKPKPLKVTGRLKAMKGVTCGHGHRHQEHQSRVDRAFGKPGIQGDSHLPSLHHGRNLQCRIHRRGRRR